MARWRERERDSRPADARGRRAQRFAAALALALLTPAMQMARAAPAGHQTTEFSGIPNLLSTPSDHPAVDDVFRFFIPGTDVRPLPANIRSDEALTKLARPAPTLLEPAIASLGTDGNEFVVLTRGAMNAPNLCERLSNLSQTAYENGFHEIAVSDVDDPNGAVQFCSLRNPKAGKLTRVSQIIARPHAPIRPNPRERAAARARAVRLASAQGLQVDQLEIGEGKVEVAFENKTYPTETEAYGRLSRVLMDMMPPDVEQFQMTSLEGGMPTREILIARSALERVLEARGSGTELLPSIEMTAASPDAAILSAPLATPYPRFDWAILPQYNQSLFNADESYRYQFLLGVAGGVDLMRGLRAEAKFQVDLANNFDHLAASSSQLPHVRSDYKNYFEKGRAGIAELQASYSATLDRGLFAQARIGYLEEMFAGAGGELLWRPEGERWAIGVTAYEVWQRGFDQLFELRAYHVFTGHISFYYQVTDEDLSFRAHAGRFLAGDYGATFEVVRRFDSGVEFGAYATFTNVSAAKYGNGSFDKGIFIRMPMDWLLPVDQRSHFDVMLNPLLRDGGQRLVGEESLYDDTRMSSYGEVFRGLDQIVEPQ